MLTRRRPGPQLLVKARTGPVVQSNFTLNVNGQDFPCSKETLIEIVKNSELDFKTSDKLSITVSFDSSVNLQEDKKLKNLMQSILNGLPTFIGEDPNLKAFIDYLKIENYVSKETLEQLANEMERLTNLDTFFLTGNGNINNEDVNFEQSVDDETLIHLFIGLLIADHENPDKYINLMLDYINKRGKTFESNLKRVTLNILKSAIENGTEVKMIHELIFIVRRLYEHKIIREIDLDLNLGNRLLPATFIDIVKNTNRQPFSVFNEYFDVLKENNYEIHKQLCHNGVNPDDIYALMRADDLDGFIQATSSTFNTVATEPGTENTFDFNKENYMKSAYERCSFINSDYMCYIDICAFFGSVKIFQYLHNDKQARLTSKTVHYAVAGGNKEIIKICEDNKLSFDGTLTEAIQFHHKDIFEWLINEQNLPINNCFDALITTCLQFASFPILKYLFELAQSHDHDELLLNCANAIEQSCKWGISPSLKFLLHHTLISKPFKGDVINAFHMACQNGNPDIITTLIHQPFVDINNKVMSIMSNQGWTGLHFAAFKGNSAAIAVLLQCDNLDINATTENNQTALHLACERSVTSAISLLVNHPKSVLNIPVKRTNLLPLHICCKRGNHEAVLLILNSNKDYGDINSLSDGQLAPLHLAAIKGSGQIVSALSQVPRIDLNLVDAENHAPLHLACINNRHECLKVLIEQKGIDVNAKCNFAFEQDIPSLVGPPSSRSSSQSDSGQEITQVKSRNGRYSFSCLKSIQPKKVDENQPITLNPLAETEVPLSPIGPVPSDNNLNLTEQTSSEFIISTPKTTLPGFNYDEKINCLFYSALTRNLKLFQPLVQHPEMDINLPNENGMTVLHICCYLGLVDFVRLLLFRENLEKNPVNKDGMTPLHLAASEGHADVVKALTTTFGVDLNPKANRDQMTPLHFACEKGRTNVVEILCEAKGVNMQEKTQSGKTPIQIACANGFSDIFAILSQNNDMSSFRRLSHDSRKPQFGFFSPAPKGGQKRPGFGPKNKIKHSLTTTTEFGK